MADKVKIGSGGSLFLGEDKTLEFEVLDDSDVPVDMTGWALTFDAKVSEFGDTSDLSKTASITGSYSATRSSNKQRAVVTLTDTDTEALNAITYQYSLKRTDAGFETIINYGDLVFERATQVS